MKLNYLLTTDQKGTAAEKIIEADLLLVGASTYKPSLSTSPCDMIVEYGGGLYKIQVKAGTQKRGRLQIDTRSPSAKGRKYTPDSYSILAAVDLLTRRVAYVSRHEIATERFRFFFTREYDLRGKPSNYVPLFFDEYLDFDRAVSSARIKALA